MSQMIMAVFSLMVFIFTRNQKFLSVCAALITINDNSCYFIINFFRRSGNSKFLLYCWYAALLCWIRVALIVCVLCRLVVYFWHGWPATCLRLGIWDRLQNFLITRDRPVGNKVTSSIYLDQGFPTFLLWSHTTCAPRIVKAYHFFQKNYFDRILVSSEEWYTLKLQQKTQLNLMRFAFDHLPPNQLVHTWPKFTNSKSKLIMLR